MNEHLPVPLRIWLVLVAVALGVVAGASSAPAAQLTLQFRDAQSQLPTAGRLQLRGPNGWLFNGTSSFYWSRLSGYFGPYVHFEDSIVVSVTTGTHTIRAVQGMVGIPVEMEIEVTGNATHTIFLDRWIDPPADGWWGGDGHVHTAHGGPAATYGPLPIGLAGMIARAEGLEVMALLDNEAATPGGPVLPAEPGVTLVWGEEYRTGFWGHVVVLGLGELLLTGGSPGCCGTFQSGYPTIATRFGLDPPPLAWIAHPHTTEDPSSSSSWPGSGFARERPALALSGAVHGFAVASGTNGAQSRWALPGYLDALRAGGRWAAVGEGDRALDRRVVPPVGQPRTFVHVGTTVAVGDPAGGALWEQGIRDAACYASTGPFLHDISVDGSMLGETVVLGGPGDVDLEFSLSSWAPVDSVLVHGSEGVHWAGHWPQGRTSLDTLLTLPIGDDDFVVLEARGPQGSWYVDEEGPRLVTSPIWIETGDPWDVPVDVARRGADEALAAWETSLVDRGYDTPADSLTTATYLLGAASLYEAMADDPPGPFTLVLPLPDTESPTATVNFQWTAAPSYDGEVTTYRVGLDTDTSFEDPVWSGPVFGTATSWPGLTAGQEYWWQVEAIEPGESSFNEGGPRRFTISSTPVAVPPPAPRFELGPARFESGEITVRLSLPRASRVAVRWYDVRGRRVHTEPLARRSAGGHVLRWNGRDARGMRVAAGAYWAMVSVEGQRRVRRVLLPPR